MIKTTLSTTLRLPKREVDPCGWFYSQRAQVCIYSHPTLGEGGQIVLTACICQTLLVISDNTRLKSKEFAAKLHMVICVFSILDICVILTCHTG